VNAANEIENITGGWVTPEYDRAGNMKAMPLAGSETDWVFATYDAWNRLRKVYEDDRDGQFEPSDGTGGGDDTLLATYEYDATGRRIEKVTTTDAPGGARQVDYYYNHDWQLLQSETDAGGAITVDQYVWSMTYIDAPVGRWHDADGNGNYEDEGDNIRYFTRDANFNVTAAIEGTYSAGWTWQLEERYVYTPYGEAFVYDADWSNPAAPSEDGPLYCGYFFDSETSVYHVRHRQYHPTLSTWLTRDPIGYAAGDANLYRYVRGQPIGLTDPSGLAAPTKSREEASQDAKELEKILPFRLVKLKEIAKQTKDHERFGYILKATEPKRQPQYKFVELISKKATETEAPYQWWGQKKAQGALFLKAQPDSQVDIDREEVAMDDLDRDYRIRFTWHTHPRGGDPWPSTRDGEESKENEIADVMVIYCPRLERGELKDRWFIWITDKDGKAYEYQEPSRQ